MNKFTKTLQHELLEMIPPAIFFFLAFHRLALTRNLAEQQYAIEATSVMGATIGALVVAKVILLADLLPFVDRFPNKPLIYNIVWKAAIYQVVAIAFRYLEQLWDFYREYGSVAAANTHMAEEVAWPHFWMTMIWLFVLFLIFCTMRELTRAVGAERMKAMIVGPLP